jgi:hypothetical protein
LHYNIVDNVRRRLMRNACDSEEMRRGRNGHGGHEKLHGNGTLDEDSAPTFLT